MFTNLIYFLRQFAFNVALCAVLANVRNSRARCFQREIFRRHRNGIVFKIKADPKMVLKVAMSIMSRVENRFGIDIEISH